MDFELTEEQKMLKKAARDWAEKEVAPLVSEAEEKEEFPRQLFPRAGELGYLGLSVPEKYGGAGGGQIMEVIFKEELARVSAGIAQGLVTIGGAIADYMTEEQKQNWLIPSVKGEKIGALGLTEANAGSDASAIQSTAVRDGDYWVLNGNKIFTTCGPIADFLLFFAYTDKSQKASKGISAFIVPTDIPGFNVTKKMTKMGIRPAMTGEEFLDNCRTPKENIIGEEGRGYSMCLAMLEAGRLWYAAYPLGIAQACIEASINYAKERVQFGLPIGVNQAVSFKVVEMAINIDAARWQLCHAAWMYDRGARRNPEPYMAKVLCAEMAMKVATDALQIHGGYGLMSDHPVQRYFRDAKFFSILMGTTQVNELVLARQLLQ